MTVQVLRVTWQENSKLSHRVKVYSTENAYHTEAVQVLQRQLSAACALLQKHGVPFEIPPINVMKMEDPFVLQEEVQKLRKKQEELVAQLDAKAYEVKALTLQVKVLRNEKLTIDAQYAQKIDRLKEELAEWKVLQVARCPYARSCVRHGLIL